MIDVNMLKNVEYFKEDRVKKNVNYIKTGARAPGDRSIQPFEFIINT
jgi:hypothetical protein